MKAFGVEYCHKRSRKTKMKNLGRQMQKNKKTTQNPNECKLDYLTSYKTLKNILRTYFHNWNSKNTKTIKTPELAS